MTRIAIAFTFVAAIAACGGKKADSAAGSAGSDPVPVATGSAGSAADVGSGSGSAAPDPNSTTTTAGPPATADVDMPTEQDFEDEAATKITDKNVEAQVKALEDELGGT